MAFVRKLPTIRVERVKAQSLLLEGGGKLTILVSDKEIARRLRGHLSTVIEGDTCHLIRLPHAPILRTSK